MTTCLVNYFIQILISQTHGTMLAPNQTGGQIELDKNALNQAQLEK